MSLSYHIRFLSFGTQHEAPDKYETGKADATGTTKRFSNQVRVYPPKKVVVSIGEWSSDHGRGGRFPKVRPADPPILILWLPLRLRKRPPGRSSRVPHCRSCRHRTEEGIHLVYARGGVWLRAFGFTPQRFRMTDISGQESLAVLPEEKAPTRSPSKPQIRPGNIPSTETDIDPQPEGGDLADFRRWVQTHLRKYEWRPTEQPEIYGRVVISFVIDTTGCLGNIRYSKPQTKNFRKRLSAYRNSPLAENRGTAGQRTGRSAPGEIYDAVRLPAINRKQGPVQMNRPLPQQYATAAYFRCGFRLRHSSTGGMIPIEITSSRSLQRCP